MLSVTLAVDEGPVIAVRLARPKTPPIASFPHPASPTTFNNSYYHMTRLPKWFLGFLLENHKLQPD